MFNPFTIIKNAFITLLLMTSRTWVGEPHDPLWNESEWSEPEQNDNEISDSMDEEIS